MELSSTNSQPEERHEKEEYYEGGYRKTQVMIQKLLEQSLCNAHVQVLTYTQASHQCYHQVAQCGS